MKAINLTVEFSTFPYFYALRKFRNFVFSTEVTINSDHNPLMYLRECAPKTAKLTRWALGFKNLILSGLIGPGSRNQADDCLSRLG